VKPGQVLLLEHAPRFGNVEHAPKMSFLFAFQPIGQGSVLARRGTQHAQQLGRMRRRDDFDETPQAWAPSASAPTIRWTAAERPILDRTSSDVLLGQEIDLVGDVEAIGPVLGLVRPEKLELA